MVGTLQEWGLAVDLLMVVVCCIYVAGILWFRQGISRPLRTAAANGSESSPPDALPFVSILVAARDEEMYIGAALDCLEKQTYPQDRYEVIVIDDGSADRTAALVRERVDATSCTLRLLPTVPEVGSAGSGGRAPGSKKLALQQGVSVAVGDIILSTDADCRVPPEWVAALAAEFSPDVGMVVGFSRIASHSERMGVRAGWEAVDFYNLMLAAMGSAGRGHALAASGQSIGFRRQAFEAVGGYRSVLHRVSGDDVLLLQLIRRSGDWQIRFCRDPIATVLHPPARSWRSLLSQRARWASNAPCQMRLDPVFFGYLGTTFLFGLMQILSPLLLWWGVLSVPVLALVWICKVATEWSLLSRGLRLLPVDDLRLYYLLWTCLHPVYLVGAGVLGCLGRFSWKNTAFRRGEWDSAHIAQTGG